MPIFVLMASELDMLWLQVWIAIDVVFGFVVSLSALPGGVAAVSEPSSDDFELSSRRKVLKYICEMSTVGNYTTEIKHVIK